jgi:hypothetical protein
VTGWPTQRATTSMNCDQQKDKLDDSWVAGAQLFGIVQAAIEGRPKMDIALKNFSSRPQNLPRGREHSKSDARRPRRHRHWIGRSRRLHYLLRSRGSGAHACDLGAGAGKHPELTLENTMLRLASSLAASRSKRLALRLQLALAFTSVFLLIPVFGQQLAKRLTNQDIVEMKSLGLSDDVIIAKIRSVASSEALKFDTSIEGLKTLKAAQVSDEVLKVMLNPAHASPTVIVGGTVISTDPDLPPPEVGVYWKDGSNFILLQSMALSQAKVGGKAGAFFTRGMRSEHWDATIDGPTSKNRVNDRRPVFDFYVADGATASDYVLLKLEKKHDHREFQIGSFGGITGGKSGIKKDKEIPYKTEHVGVRAYKIMLESELQPGEYAFFMGTGQQATMASGGGSARSGGSASGRIYDFTIPE